MNEAVRLCKQIELESEAMRPALYEYAPVASHQVIEQRYNALRRYQEDLERLAGKEEVKSIVVQTYAKAVA